MLEPQRQALLADEGDAAIEGEESAPAGDGKERIAHCRAAPGSKGWIALPFDPYACNAAHDREQDKGGEDQKGHREALMRLVPIVGGARVDFERHRQRQRRHGGLFHHFLDDRERTLDFALGNLENQLVVHL